MNATSLAAVSKNGCAAARAPAAVPGDAAAGFDFAALLASLGAAVEADGLVTADPEAAATADADTERPSETPADLLFASVCPTPTPTPPDATPVGLPPGMTGAAVPTEPAPATGPVPAPAGATDAVGAVAAPGEPALSPAQAEAALPSARDTLHTPQGDAPQRAETASPADRARAGTTRDVAHAEPGLPESPGASRDAPGAAVREAAQGATPTAPHAATPAAGVLPAPALAHAPAHAQVHTLAAAAAPTIAPPLDSPQFAPALAAQVSLLARDGVQQAELRLNPAEMGPIAVRIELADNATAVVHFAAEIAATRDAIESSLPDLAGALREAGLTLVGGGVSEQPARGRRDDDGHAASDGTPGRERGDGGADGTLPDAAQPQRRTRGVVDLLA